MPEKTKLEIGLNKIQKVLSPFSETLDKGNKRNAEDVALDQELVSTVMKRLKAENWTRIPFLCKVAMINLGAPDQASVFEDIFCQHGGVPKSMAEAEGMGFERRMGGSYLRQDCRLKQSSD